MTFFGQHLQSHPARRGRSAVPWVFWTFVTIAAYFLFTEHRAHVVSWLPWLLLLACPLLHWTMHARTHAQHAGHGDNASRTSAQSPPSNPMHPDRAGSRQGATERSGP